jgi:dipeptidyl aminopeptidase/acylaminoacyl peptidase
LGLFESRLVVLGLLAVAMPVLGAPVCSAHARPRSPQQQAEVAFDPTPVALPQSDSGPARLVTSKDLLSLREVHGLSISPDGKWVAFVVGQADYETNGYRSGLFLVRTSGAAPVCLGSAGMPHWTSFNEWISEQPQWSKDSRLILYRLRVRKDELWEVWQWDTEGAGSKPLTHVPGDVVRYGLDSSGQKIFMQVELRTPPDSEKQLLEQGIFYSDQMIPWEGMPSILKNLRSAGRKSEVWVHELNTGIERIATEEEKRSFEPDVREFQQAFDKAAQGGTEKCHIDSVALAPDNKNAALMCSYDDTEPSRIMRWKFFLMSHDGQRRLELAPDSIRVTDYWWDTDGTHLYFVSSQWDGRPGRMRVVDVDSGQVRDLLHPTEVLQEFSVDAADRWIAGTRETNVSPPEVVVIDQGTGATRKLADLNPEFRHIKLSSVERISGVNPYGEEWFGQLVKPVGYEEGKRYPLIVTLYRSGDYFLLGATGNENPIQVYAARGFVVLSFNIGRNRLRKRGDFDDYLLNWASPTASLEMAVQSLVETGIVDPKKVGLAGLSRGAEILEYAISHSHMFQAAVESGPGARDPFFYYMAGRNWHKIFAKWGLSGWPEGESKKNWDRLAASLNADHIETPLLMNSPDSEFLGNMALFTSLEKLHKPVELYIYANELHIKNQPKHRYEIYERNVDWFQFWLEDHKDSSPEKRDQYSRWEELRDTWTQCQVHCSSPE